MTDTNKSLIIYYEECKKSVPKINEIEKQNGQRALNAVLSFIKRNIFAQGILISGSKLWLSCGESLATVSEILV